MNRARPGRTLGRAPGGDRDAAAGYATFAVDGEPYLYDTATNAILAIPPAVAALLAEEHGRARGVRGVRRTGAARLGTEAREEAAAFLRACRARGMLRPVPPLDFLASAGGARLRRHYRQPLTRMTLGITEECNQRCRYCPFGGASRGPATRRAMTWEIARRGVDHLLSGARRRRAAAPILELFGGEPLLEWALVERIVRHVRRDLGREDVELVLYTNGTLLGRDRLRVLVEHDVTLQVSLDGPRRVHDRARVLSGGGATHARVSRLLGWLRREAPAYYGARVRIHCTFDLESDLLEVVRYFDRPAFRGLPLSFGYRTGDRRVTRADRVRHEAELDALDAWHLRALAQRRPFPRALYASILRAALGAVLTRRVEPARRAPQPNDACLPGQTRCFVSPAGSIHPCENHSRPGSELGQVGRGLDLRKARALLRAHARLCNETCQGCWAYRLCSHCFLQSLAPDGRPSRRRKVKACRAERERNLLALRRWVRLWRAEPPWAGRVEGTLRHLVR